MWNFECASYTLIPDTAFKAGIGRLMQSQIAQLKSKNRQEGDQFFYQMSDFCENCNPYSSKSYTPSPPLVNVWLIHDFQRHETEIVYIFKDFYWFELWGFIACSNPWAWSFKHVPLTLKRDPCSSQAQCTPQSAKRSTYLATKWATNGVFVWGLGVRFKKSTFWVQKVILRVLHSNQSWLQAWQ